MMFNLFRPAAAVDRVHGRLIAQPALRSASPESSTLNLLARSTLALLLLCSGCALFGPRLPPVDVAEPGWTLSQGQAVWRTARNAPELAGELIVATNTDGRTFVQFSKNPFPLLVAQAASRGWEVRIPTRNQHYAGRGSPPVRVIWLYIPRLLAGSAPPPYWHWQAASDGTFHLQNDRTGERIEGFLSQ